VATATASSRHAAAMVLTRAEEGRLLVSAVAEPEVAKSTAQASGSRVGRVAPPLPAASLCTTVLPLGVDTQAATCMVVLIAALALTVRNRKRDRALALWGLLHQQLRSPTATRRCNASWKRARLHVRCLIILAWFGSCGAQSSGPPSAWSAPGAMDVSSLTGRAMTTTASDVALHGRHLSEVSASTVGEFIAAVSNSAVDKILLAVGTYELTSNMCPSSVVSGAAVCISRNLTIEAEQPGAVVLDAMGRNRVIIIPQPGVTVELIGLNITGGYASKVQSVCLSNPLQHLLQYPNGMLTLCRFCRARDYLGFFKAT